MEWLGTKPSISCSGCFCKALAVSRRVSESGAGVLGADVSRTSVSSWVHCVCIPYCLPWRQALMGRWLGSSLGCSWHLCFPLFHQKRKHFSSAPVKCHRNSDGADLSSMPIPMVRERGRRQSVRGHNPHCKHMQGREGTLLHSPTQGMIPWSTD